MAQDALGQNQSSAQGGRSSVKRPILWRLMLWIGLPLLIVYCAVLVLNYFWGRRHALQQTEEYLVELTGHHAAELDRQFAQVAQSPIVIADALETLGMPTEEGLYSLVSKRLAGSPRIFGMAVAFEPFSFSADLERFSPYVYRDREDLIALDLAQSYNYLARDWYAIPKALGRAYWTEPYYDEGGGNILMCTFSTPIHADEQVIGIATADISLEDLESRMKSIDIMAGYTLVLSRTGKFLYHPRQEYVMSESIFSLAEDYGDPALREIGKHMIEGSQGIVPYDNPRTGATEWLVYTPIPSCRWSFAAVIPEEEVLASVRGLTVRQSVVMVIGLAVITTVIVWASISITNPIRKLDEFARTLAAGNLDIQIEDTGAEDEIQELAEVLNKMATDLKAHIRDLTEVTRAKESVESELRIARQIQESLIPRTFPPFPDRQEFALHAENIPAKEIAGDFYDFFFIDEDRLVLIIADVSGKGIPSALFMAVTRTLMKIACQRGVGPSRALEEANVILAEDNEACMFVTLFLALYDVKTGHLTYANAGHNPPFVLSQSGDTHVLESLGDLPLGIRGGHQFQVAQACLDVNQTLVLYTDGITEAMDPDDQIYGEERFLENLTANASDGIEELLQKLMKDVHSFQGDRQADDITLLLLRRNSDPTPCVLEAV